MANTINCPVCGKLTDSRLDSCPHCGAYLRSRKVAAAQAGPKKNCPQCGSVVQEGDIICVSCGTNLLTGQKIVDGVVLQRERSFPVGWAVGASVALLLVATVAVLWIYGITRDPLSQAQRLAADGETLEALTILEAYVQRAPEDASALKLLGRLQWQNRQYGSASETFARASEIDRSDPDLAVYAAVALVRANPLGSSRLIPMLERAAELQGGNPGLWYALGLAKGARGDYAGQVEALGRVLELEVTNDSAHLSLGVAQALQGRYEDARSELMVIGPGERRAEAQAAMGFVAALEGDNEDARRKLSDAVQSEDVASAAQAYVLLGKLSMREGDFAQAQLQFERALSVDAKVDVAHYLRAVALQARGRYQDAVTEYERLNNGKYAARASVQIGEIQLALNAPDRARRALDQAERAGADSAAFYTAQGRLALTEDNEEGALQAFSRALGADPAYAAAYLERGLVHIRRETVADGLADLDRYLELVEPDPAGARVADVRALVEQLRQASQDDSVRTRGARV